MDEPNGHQCPECGALRTRANTPSCACTQRAADALREARTAEAAAAEDFDPLRIRPYVEIEGGAGEGVGAGREERAGADATMPLRAVAPEGGGPVDATAVLPIPLAAPSGAPRGTDVSPFEGAAVEGAHDSGAEPGEPRRRRAVLLGVAAGVVAVVAAAGYASGLFSYETPSRDGSASKDVRAAVPAPSTSAAPPPAPTTPGPASPTPTPTASPSTASPSPTPSESASSAPPSPSPSTEPSPSPTPTATPTSLQPDDDAARRSKTEPVVLRQGDRGPEVSELQQRLRQLHLYNDDIDGTYNTQVENAVRNYQWSRDVQDDELGVYGTATRAALEGETEEP
ncbi:peptidoglycan-binding protein [Streptomyces griseus]|uniref:peptidoglycan-binding domain-containing protein n=1 Tax=Streptomyces griseus TaxID=1911 RepID=UPI00055E6EF5|nr:peptidoglycan-binding domain-containing protein [Streptomyces griseus]